MSIEFIESNLSARLERFKKSGSTYEFRCPYCGDGKNPKSKRGNFFISKGEWIFNCYNCSESKSLKNFVSDHFPDLKRFFILQSLRADTMCEITLSPNTTYQDDGSWFIPANESIIAVEYMKSRGITNLQDTFYTSVAPHEVIGKKNGLYGEPCIVFPLKSLATHKLSGYQLRSIRSDSKLRYSTICYEKSYFGEITDSPILVEGIFDSLSVNNSIAILGSGSSMKLDNSIWFLDQEPHNKEIVKKMKKLIQSGETITMLPKDYRGLDANDMLKSGMSRSEIETLVRANSFSGERALIKLNLEWVL